MTSQKILFSSPPLGKTLVALLSMAVKELDKMFKAAALFTMLTTVRISEIMKMAQLKMYNFKLPLKLNVSK